MHDRGFKEVELKSHGAAAADHDRVDLDSPWPGDPEADKGKDTKIIFHPPRSHGASGSRRNACRNTLFMEALGERTRDKNSKTLHFQFPTTLKWYMRQKAEGRHFEHIRFETWESLFKVLKMGTDSGSTSSKAPASSGASI